MGSALVSTEQLVKTCRLPVSAADAYDWHMREGAFWRLSPAWEDIEFVSGDPTPHEGSVLRFRVKQGPLQIEWKARHSNFVPGTEFTDTQEQGPFAYWQHVHKMRDDANGRSKLEDNVEYRLPLALSFNPLAQRVVRMKIEQIFEYRHTVLVNDLRYYAKYRSAKRKKILVLGDQAAIGTQLVPFLLTQGHKVTSLSSLIGEKFEHLQELQAAIENLEPSRVQEFDAIINLSCETVLNENQASGSYTAEELVNSARALVALIIKSAPNMVLVNLSSVEIYGRQAGDEVDEHSSISDDWRAQYLSMLEAITSDAAQAGIRTVNLRMGHLIAPKSGFIKALLSVYRPGSALDLHSGSNISWISLCDAVYAIYHSIMNATVKGTLNVVSPNPVSASELAAKLNKIVMPHSLLSLPPSQRTLAEIERDDCIALGTRFEESGFQCLFADLEATLRHLVGKAHGEAQSLFASI